MASIRNLVKSEAKTAAIYVGTSALNQLASFVLIPFYWQVLTPADYGVIAITEIITRFLSCFFGLQLGMGITLFFHDWPESERKQRLGTLWIGHWASTLLMGGLAMGLVWLVSPVIFPSVAFFPYLFLGIISAILKNMQEVLDDTLRIKKMPVTFAVFNLGGFFVRVFFSILYVLILDRKLLGYFEGLIVGNTVVVVGSGVLMLFHARLSFRLSWLREVLHFTVPIIWSGVLNKLSSIADRFMLQYLASLEVLGIYALSLKFAQVLTQFNGAIKMSYVPFLFKTISKDNKMADSDGRSLIARMSVIYFLPLVAVACLISVFIRDFVLFLDKPAYFPIINVVPFVVSAQLIAAAYLYFAPGLLLSKKTKLLWIPSLCRVLVYLVLGPVFVLLYGLYGMIGCLLIATCIYFCVSFYLSQKHFPIPMRIGRVGLMAIVYAGIVSSAYWIQFDILWLDIVIKCAYSSVILLVFLKYAFNDRKIEL